MIKTKLIKADLIKKLEKKNVRKECKKWADDVGYSDTPIEWSACKFSYEAGFYLAMKIIRDF